MAEQQLTNEELADLLKKGAEGVKEFNEYRHEHPSQEIDFSGYDFSGLQLIDTRFAHPMKLDNTNLSESDLTRADFDGACGKNTNFTAALCEMACFSEAVFLDAVFHNAGFNEARFFDARLDGSSFKDAECCGTVFNGASLLLANFENADLAEASLVRTDLRSTIFDGADIETANFAQAKNMPPNLVLEIIKNLVEGWQE